MMKNQHPLFGVLPDKQPTSEDAVVRQILRDHPVPIAASSPSKMYYVLLELKRVLDAGVPGHVVELGCFGGETTTRIRRLLDLLGVRDRELHVFDSWQGAPPLVPQDIPTDTRIGPFSRTACVSSREAFVARFQAEKLQLPHVHSGFFASIPDAEYPAPIAFALFDGDIYPSIMDSFAKVYHKLSKGARVVIDDYEWEHTPGVKIACSDFLVHKPEREKEIRDYYGPNLGGGAVMVKL
jgi:O-methyltransferase